MLVHLGLPQWQMRCEVKPIQSFFLFNQIQLLQRNQTFKSNPTCAGSLRWVRLLGLNSCSPCSRLTCSNHLVNKIKIKIHPPRSDKMIIVLVVATNNEEKCCKDQLISGYRRVSFQDTKQESKVRRENASLRFNWCFGRENIHVFGWGINFFRECSNQISSAAWILLSEDGSTNTKGDLLLWFNYTCNQPWRLDRWHANAVFGFCKLMFCPLSGETTSPQTVTLAFSEMYFLCSAGFLFVWLNHSLNARW